MGDRNIATSRQDDGNQREHAAAWDSLNVDDEDDQPTVKERRCKTCPCVAKYSQQFCQRTSLHGWQYLAEDERSLLERACWMLMISVSLFGCMYVVMKQWNKWQSSPVIVSFAETSTPAWNIPFPAVTVCSEIKFSQSVLNYTELIQKHRKNNLTKDEARQLDYASLICPLNGIDNGSLVVDESVVNYLFNISPSLNDIFHYCFWRGEPRNCSEIFTRVMTDDGVCYTFNTLSVDELFTSEAVQSHIMQKSQQSKDWTLQNGYSNKFDLEDTYPRRTMSAGVNSGLSVILKADDRDGDSLCCFPVKGFRMMIHSPTIFPELRKNFFRIPSNRDVVISVHPEIISTTESLESYNPNLRQCFFEHERKLRYFKIYTQEHCEAECFSNYTVKHCGCADVPMPRSRSTPICGPHTRNCSVDQYNFDVKNRDTCNCLPSCTETDYAVQVSQASYMWERLGKEYESERLTLFHVFLRDMQVITKRRSELYGVFDFLSNVGGLLGLFLGFSVLSLAEIFYFAVARPLCSAQQNRQKRRRGRT